MKKKIAVVAAFVILLAIMAAGSVAFNTEKTTAHNVITTGSVDITVVQQQLTDGKLEVCPAGDMAVVPGMQLSKIVTIRSDSAECFVRARVEICFKDAQGNRMELTDDQIARLVTLDLNTNDWVQKEDDDIWLYYGDSVETGDSTKALFTTVTFDGRNMGNEYQNCKMELVIHGQGVQAANNGDDVMKAAGWPG